MNTVEKAAFKPNCAFVPSSCPSDTFPRIDPEEVTLLMVDGDNISGLVYSKEAWETDGEPSYMRRHGNFMNLDNSPIYEAEGQVVLLPEMFVVKLDERRYFRDDIVGLTKAIFGVYVFNSRNHVYCCELTPSFELNFIGYQYEPVEDLSDRHAEELSDLIRKCEADTAEVNYYHVCAMQKIMENSCEPGFLPKNGKNGGYPIETDYIDTDDAIDELRERHQGSEL